MEQSTNYLNYSPQQLEIFKNDSRYTLNGFFNLKGYIEQIVGFNWRNRAFSLLIQAERNMGKSYGTWDFIEKEIWIKSNFQERIAYCRTNLTKLKSVKSFFNSKYSGKYLMTDTHIWKIELDENGKEIKEARIELGAVIGVMNEENWRSGEFANYKMIFWDEYNEALTLNGLFTHWVNLFKTIERMTPNVIAILVGNKISANNDILINLEIEPHENEDGEDYYEERPLNSLEPSIYFLNIGKNTFKHLEQEKKQANIWASCNNQTDKFMNGADYLNKKAEDVMLYRLNVLPTRKIKNYVSYRENIYEYGEFEKGYYFHIVYEMEDDYNILALDKLSYMSNPNSIKYCEDVDYRDLATMLSHKMKNRKLFFTSYEAKRDIGNFINAYSSFVNR